MALLKTANTSLTDPEEGVEIPDAYHSMRRIRIEDRVSASITMAKDAEKGAEGKFIQGAESEVYLPDPDGTFRSLFKLMGWVLLKRVHPRYQDGQDVLTEKQASLLAKAEKAVDALLEAMEVTTRC